ncbi:MAG: ACP S-malonyltransferase [Cellulosilyticum sp.]|nr:ACP S-malonyltransferase [Cellulosilyticum sp.]
MKVALLFPGQGAQYVGMGKELYQYYSVTKQIYDEAACFLDWDIKEVCFKDQNELIHQTRYTQGALFTTNYGIYEALKAEGIKAEAVLGFSLGEYNAIAASGVLSFKEVLKLVDLRATYMEECAKTKPGGMSAIIGMDAEKVYSLCQQISEQVGSPVTVANDNCEGQVTIAGTSKALEVAHTFFKEAGAKRVVPLKVSGAFHSQLMLQAAKKLETHLPELTFKESEIPIVSNVTARFISSEEVRENIPLQIVKGVRFRESILYLIEQGFDTFIEVGPKCTLSNLVKKISNKVTVLQVEDLESLKQVVQKVRGVLC